MKIKLNKSDPPLTRRTKEYMNNHILNDQNTALAANAITGKNKK